jgi:hypothetical protein
MHVENLNEKKNEVSKNNNDNIVVQNSPHVLEQTIIPLLRIE